MIGTSELLHTYSNVSTKWFGLADLITFIIIDIIITYKFARKKR